MATKVAIRQADVDALVKGFCLGCGFHLGAVTPRPYAVKKQGLYDLIGTQFSWLLEKGWTYGELDELVKEATREKRMLREPGDLVDGRVSRSQRKDPERNLLADVPGERKFHHPLLQVMRMPVFCLGEDRQTHTEEEGYVGGYVESFTMRELVDYWTERIAPPSQESTLIGQLTWLCDQHGPVEVLHAVDKLAESLSEERDLWSRGHTDGFALKKFILEVEKDREEAKKWL